MSGIPDTEPNTGPGPITTKVVKVPLHGDANATVQPAMDAPDKKSNVVNNAPTSGLADPKDSPTLLLENIPSGTAAEPALPDSPTDSTPQCGQPANFDNDASTVNDSVGGTALSLAVTSVPVAAVYESSASADLPDTLSLASEGQILEDTGTICRAVIRRLFKYPFPFNCCGVLHIAI